MAKLKVIASADGYLNAWLDIDKNGDWLGEKIFSDRPLFAGVNTLTFSVSAAATD
jgi:hypothetical protein